MREVKDMPPRYPKFTPMFETVYYLKLQSHRMRSLFPVELKICIGRTCGFFTDVKCKFVGQKMSANAPTRDCREYKYQRMVCHSKEKFIESIQTVLT